MRASLLLALLAVGGAWATDEHPADMTVVAGKEAVFRVDRSGALTWLWYRDGLPLTAANGPELRFVAAEVDDGSVYKVVTTSQTGHAWTSRTATLTVLPASSTLPVDIVAPAPGTVLPRGTEVAFLASGHDLDWQFELLDDGAGPFAPDARFDALQTARVNLPWTDGFGGPQQLRVTITGPDGSRTVTYDTVEPEVAPVANADTYTAADHPVTVGGSLSIPAIGGVLTNDTDGNGDGLTAVLVSQPDRGVVTLQPDGSFVYVDDEGDNVSGPAFVSFSYKASDGSLESEPTRVGLYLVPDGAPATAVPAAPSDLAATWDEATGVATFTWTDNSNVENGFEFRFYPTSKDRGPQHITDASSGVIVLVVSPPNPEVNRTSHSCGLARYYSWSVTVRAKNDNGNSDWSDPVVLDTGTLVIAAPTGLTATAPSADRVRLDWADASDNEDGFHIQRMPDGGEWEYIGTGAANTGAWFDATVAAGTTYHYRVLAGNLDGNSDWSEVATVDVPTIDPGLPAAPDGLVVTPGPYRSLALGWNDNADDELVYVVERRQQPLTWQAIATLPGGSVSLLDDNAHSSTCYDYRVRARNAAGWSTYSNVASYTTNWVRRSVSLVTPGYTWEADPASLGDVYRGPSTTVFLYLCGEDDYVFVPKLVTDG